MKKNKKYILIKKKNKKVKVILNSNNCDGYSIKPKNSIVYDGITVNSMLIVNNDLVKTLLKKKIKKKLDLYLQFLINVLDEEDTDSGHLMFALNDLDRYRRLVINNYQKYLEKKYIKILMDKFDLLEQELRLRIKNDVKNLVFEQVEFNLEETKSRRKR